MDDTGSWDPCRPETTRAFSMKVHSAYKWAGAGLGRAILEPGQREGEPLSENENGSHSPAAHLPPGKFLLDMGPQTAHSQGPCRWSKCVQEAGSKAVGVVATGQLETGVLQLHLL